MMPWLGYLKAKLKNKKEEYHNHMHSQMFLLDPEALFLY